MSTRPRLNLPPGPPSVFQLRHVLALRRDPTGFLLRLAARYGDVSHFRAGPLRVVLLNDPDLIKDVLVTRQHLFRKGAALQRMKFLLGEGLLTSEGEFHDRQRRLILPAFHRQRIASYGDLMAAHAARTRDAWADGATPDIYAEMKALTMRIVCDALFGADAGREFPRAAEPVNDTINRFHLFGPPGLGPKALLTLVRTPRRTGRPVSTGRDALNEVVYKIIAERRREGARDRGDLLSMLLRAEVESGEGGAPMTDEQVRDEVVILFVAGYETIASTLATALHLLSRHSDVQARLHAELDEVLGERLPAYDDIPRLTYTNMLLAETLRDFPAAWVTSRRPSEDVELGGFHVPAGSLVLMSPHVTQHDARYFPDPFRFDPERWTESAQRSRPEFSYFPFGGGKRRCVGEGFALAEGVVVLATLARRWRFAPVSGRPAQFHYGVIARPAGNLRVRVERR
ncbi:MAG TPA: cytochrome P450 [Pyrinomonadaceae bacterium]|nr:cytochrome P450 [Pyrinomonadaceae bacterium]